MSYNSKLRVAVLRGGPSKEYDVSLKTGENILSILRNREEKYDPLDVFITKDGVWHSHGLPGEPHEVLAHIDIVWNGLHGEYGEDGRVQKILEELNIPYTGSAPIPSAIAMHKDKAKKIYKDNDLITPAHTTLEKENLTKDKLIEIFRNFLHPVIIKPSNGGSSIGIRMAHTFQELEEMTRNALEETERVIIEEFIRGREATCGVIDDVRGEKTYALIPVEIVKDRNRKFFDYEGKYEGKSSENCPGSFTVEENRKIEQAAKDAHRALGARHYSRSDFILTPKGKLYILETNTLPGFTKDSLFSKALKATGWKEEDFVDHVIQLALGN